MSSPMAAAPGALPPLPPNINQITTPLLMGNVVNWYLFGVLCVQVYIYYNSFPDDRKMIKLLVYGVFILDTLQTCLSGADLYYWFGSGFGNILHLGNPYISAYDTPMLGSIIALIVQGFFCYRIWMFEKAAWWLSILIGAISIIQCVAGFVGAVRGIIAAHLGVTASTLVPLYLWLIGDAVADVLIAGTMVFILLRHRNPDHQYTSTVLMRTVRLVVETNALTASFALLAVALHSAKPDTNYFFAPTLAIGKIYSNTLVATFNNRLFLQRESHGLSTPHSSRFHIRAQSSGAERSYDSGAKFRSQSEMESGGEIHLDNVRNTIKISSMTTTRDL